jgi:hypothetical protein
MAPNRFAPANQRQISATKIYRADVAIINALRDPFYYCVGMTLKAADKKTPTTDSCFMLVQS